MGNPPRSLWYLFPCTLAFTAIDSKMEVQIEFTFNASELGGKVLVIFEELYNVSNPDEPIKVAGHKDNEDKGQTVTVKEQPESPATPEESDTPETPSRAGSSPKTGDNTPLTAHCWLCLKFPVLVISSQPIRDFTKRKLTNTGGIG